MHPRYFGPKGNSLQLAYVREEEEFIKLCLTHFCRTAKRKILTEFQRSRLENRVPEKSV
jgi:hypothetical protein